MVLSRRRKALKYLRVFTRLEELRLTSTALELAGLEWVEAHGYVRSHAIVECLLNLDE